MRRLTTKKLTKRDRKEVEKLYKKYKRHIEKVSRYISNICKIPVQDLMQEGYFGLVKARELYDKEKASFLTYAKYWIRLAIYSYACAFQYPLSFPANFYSIYSKYREMKNAGLSDEEVSAKMGITENRISKVIKSIHSIKTAMPLGIPNASGNLNDITSDKDFASDFCGDQDSEEFLLKVKALVTGQEYFVLNHIYALECSQPKTLSWLGVIMKVTKERVRQIKNGALEKIREHLESSSYV